MVGYKQAMQKTEAINKAPSQMTLKWVIRQYGPLSEIIRDRRVSSAAGGCECACDILKQENTSVVNDDNTH